MKSALRAVVVLSCACQFVVQRATVIGTERFGLAADDYMTSDLLVARNGAPPAYQFDAGHGEFITVMADRIQAQPGNSQWVLVAPGPSSGAYDANDFDHAVHLDAKLLGFDPVSVGFPPDLNDSGSPVSFTSLISQSSDVRPFRIPTGLIQPVGRPFLAIDITDYVRSRDVHQNDIGTYFDVGLAIRDVDPSSVPGYLAVFNDGLLVESRDGSREHPYLPYPVNGASEFPSLPPGYYDPAAASGFNYQLADGARFTRAFDFPTGFNGPFTVLVDGQVVGQYAAGDTVDFSSFPGGGVTSFTVKGINPTVDSSDPLAFPLGLDFDRATAIVTMVAVPEPSTWALAAFGALSMVVIRLRPRCASVVRQR